ncbi:cobalamin-binding protein [Tabrizicola piscis]|uniref:Cobalamin-binding protein n=1 Tax=Tabrizicola piscis TaxID=2494374 RepID=A0A3S8U389_9RHOB|nr:cobalamin-dependent protein [Tabrizicola piscis]AZL58061.1 cobalamin-binding protein [Tabrizicola piscis]
MSEEFHPIPGFPVPQVARAHESLVRRGETLSVTALRVLAREVILRVSRSEAPVALHNDHPGSAAIELLCDALLSRDDTAAADLVQSARLDGMSADTIYHVYLAEAARRLGQRWDRDEATAAEVILGAGRIYAILRDLRTVFLAQRLVAPPGAEAIFASVPGEVHGIGATIAADTMRRRGWDISLRLGLGHDALVEEIARLQPTMLGLSASLPSMTFATARLIVALRIRCPHIWILVAGQIVAHDPDIARIVDADAAAATLDEAEATLTGHLAELTRLSVRQM